MHHRPHFCGSNARAERDVPARPDRREEDYRHGDDGTGGRLEPARSHNAVVEDGNELVINGRKMWCSNASIADIINVTCADGSDDRGANLRRVVVETDNPNRSHRNRDYGPQDGAPIGDRF